LLYGSRPGIHGVFDRDVQSVRANRKQLRPHPVTCGSFRSLGHREREASGRRDGLGASPWTRVSAISIKMDVMATALIGPSWTKNELHELSRRGQAEVVSDKRNRAWKAFTRDQRSLWSQMVDCARVGFHCVFPVCCVSDPVQRFPVRGTAL
jgi:hypothetical protein